MAVIKRINVTNPPLQTGEVTAGADITTLYYRTRATGGGTVKSPWVQLNSVSAGTPLVAGAKYEISDATGFTISMNGPVTDALAMAYLDATFIAGDVIEFSLDASNVTNRLAAVVIPGYDDAGVV
jgi:hypothetical protein